MLYDIAFSLQALYIGNKKDNLIVKYFRKKIIARFLELSFINAKQKRNIIVKYDLIGCPKHCKYK